MHPVLLNDIDSDCCRTLCKYRESACGSTVEVVKVQSNSKSNEASSNTVSMVSICTSSSGDTCVVVCDSMTNLIDGFRSNRYPQIKMRKSASAKKSVDVLVGGMPCQSFSHAGLRKGLDDERGQLLLRFADLVRYLSPRVFVVENVRGLMTHENGKTLEGVLEVLSMEGEYVLHYKLLNAWDYGVPQKRERIFIVGIHRSVKHANDYQFPAPLTTRPTLKDVIGHPASALSNSEGMRYSAHKRSIMEKIPMGGCWVDLPTEEEKKRYLGKSYYSSGGRRGVLRRLSLDKPAPTLLCNPQAKQSELCHPIETRPLNIREYARVQTFPDTLQFHGSIASQYRQIGNAVPVSLAYHVGKSIANFLLKNTNNTL